MLKLFTPPATKRNLGCAANKHDMAADCVFLRSFTRIRVCEKSITCKIIYFQDNAWYWKHTAHCNVIDDNKTDRTVMVHMQGISARLHRTTKRRHQSTPPPPPPHTHTPMLLLIAVQIAFSSIKYKSRHS